MELTVNPKSVVIGSLGSRVLIGAGLLSYLQIQGRLDLVSRWQGFGSGAVLCFLLSIGVTYEELIDDLCTLEISEWIPFQSRSQPPTWSSIRKILEQRLQSKFPSYHLEHLTLAKLYSITRSRLELQVFNATTDHLELLNWETQPQLYCLDAVFASMATPGILPAYPIHGCSYQDPTFLFSIPLTFKSEELILGARNPYSNTDLNPLFPTLEESLLGLIGSLTQNRCRYPIGSCLLDHLEPSSLEMDLRQGWEWMEEYFRLQQKTVSSNPLSDVSSGENHLATIERKEEQ
jgi:hypothetical protein